MKKIYYLMRFVLRSPLRIGNGMHELSDSDLMLDGRKLPFIPGSSLAGIIRHRSEQICGDKSVMDRLFGVIKESDESKKEIVIMPSAVMIGDAVIRNDAAAENVYISGRDGVGLGEWETAQKGAKFDFQIAETDQEFYSVVEWTGNDDQETAEITNVLEPVLKSFIATGMSAGARTSRGYGKFAVDIVKKAFLFPDDLDDWIKFDAYAEDAFKQGTALEGRLLKTESVIRIAFRMKSTFSVRVRTARVEVMDDGSRPDAVPLKDFKGNPIIPGTAWAGVFRHHMHHLLRDTGVEELSPEMNAVDRIFGMSNKKGEMFKSLINFSETAICIEDEKKQRLTIMRTAIDRFTASPRNGALYTNMVYSGGKGELIIEFRTDELTSGQKALLAACICDMHTGLLTVGGQSSVGSGLMQIEKISVNGADRTADMEASVNDGAPLNWLEVTENE